MTDDEIDEIWIQRQVAFLQTRSPDDWHRAANDHNWDDRLDILFWIVRQPLCDKATALLIFWKGEPTGYDFGTEQEEMGDDPYAVAPMLNYIVRRFNTTGYPRSGIAFDILTARGADLPTFLGFNIGRIMNDGLRQEFAELDARQNTIADPQVKIHPEMKRPIRGRKIGGPGDKSDFYDLFPRNLGGYDLESGAI